MAVNNAVNVKPVVTGTANQIAVSNAADNSTSTLSLPANVKNSGQTLFMAYLNTTQSNATGDNTDAKITYDTTTVNQGTAYSTSTGTFTAPIAGNYLFTIGTLVQEGSAVTSINLFLTTSLSPASYTIGYIGFTTTSITTGLGGSIILPLALNSTVQVHIIGTGASKTTSIAGLIGGGVTNHFSGTLLPA